MGETWLASIELIGELDHQGMVCDFGHAKKMLRSWLDENLDHRLLVPSKAPQLVKNPSAFNNLDLGWRLPGDEVINTKSPAQAVTLVDCAEISPETVAKWCLTKLKPLFPATISQLKLNFTAEAINGPFYHYSHGLKKHKGNCQRIAHGHRSRILIWKNGEICATEMQNWSRRLRDIYIGTQSDLLPAKVTKNYAFAYKAEQGEFYLELPKRCCYLVDTDTTVEFISHHIAKTLKMMHPNDTFKVKAFEGLAKGAIEEL